MTLREKENESHDHPDLPEYTWLVKETAMVQIQNFQFQAQYFSCHTPAASLLVRSWVADDMFLVWFWRNKDSEVTAHSGVLC